MHRNIANIIGPTDINTSAVIEYAVGVLKVKHVVLCGHTACGGAAAVLADARVGGVLDTWLTPLKAVRNANRAELDGIKDAGKRAARIAELNVEAGVRVLMANSTIQDHIAERGLEVHGTIFDIAEGRVKDLGFGTGKSDGKSAVKKASPGAATFEPEEIVRGKHAQLVFRGDTADMRVL